jgi:hypothetical protein
VSQTRPAAPLAALLDAASERLLQMEENNEFASELRLSAEAYTSLAQLRGPELTDGHPLIVLGTAAMPDPNLPPGYFTLIP